MEREEIEKLINQEVNRRVDEALQPYLRFFSDYYLFERDAKFLDGRRIKTGKTNGLTIGAETDQKVGFHGSVSTQASHIANPTGSGDAGVDTPARTAINAILVALENKGITASS